MWLQSCMAPHFTEAADVQFQKKCVGKMREVSVSQGRTVLFVSHSMDSIQRLCSKCVLLDYGQIVANGDVETAVARYTSTYSQRARPNQWVDVSLDRRTGTGRARFAAVQYKNADEADEFRVFPHSSVEFLLAIESDSPRSVGSLAVTLYAVSGTKLANADTLALGRPVSLRQGRTLVRLRIDKLYLNPGI
jgi:lipopolysaccharide transport system ATP-binding protein